MPEPADLVRTLAPIVREAGSMALKSQKGTSRAIKPDGSIVTPADRQVEEFLRQELLNLVPNAGVCGEEMGSSHEKEAGLWCIDPIDGTSNYAFGSPIWGVSVGLIRGEETLLGLLFFPSLDEMYTGALGEGAYLNGQRLDQISPGKIRPEELISCPDRIVRMYPSEDFPGKMRHSGAFVADAASTVSQRVRGLIGVREKLYDVAASLCIAQEVGADIRYADGSPLLLEPLKQPKSRLEKAWIIFPRDSGF